MKFYSGLLCTEYIHRALERVSNVKQITKKGRSERKMFICTHKRYMYMDIPYRRKQFC